MTRTEELELAALEYAQLPSLPEEATPETPVWIYAVAKIRTYNMLESYAIVRNSYGETPSIIKSFGEGGVAEIMNVYPYKFLDKKFIPTFDKENTAKQFVSKVYDVEKEKVATLKKDVLLRLIYNYCIKRQLQAEADERSRKQASIERENLYEEVKKLRKEI